MRKEFENSWNTEFEDFEILVSKISELEVGEFRLHPTGKASDRRSFDEVDGESIRLRVSRPNSRAPSVVDFPISWKRATEGKHTSDRFAVRSLRTNFLFSQIPAAIA